MKLWPCCSDVVPLGREYKWRDEQSKHCTTAQQKINKKFETQLQQENWHNNIQKLYKKFNSKSLQQKFITKRNSDWK